MATTFTKTGSNVVVSFEDNNYSFPEGTKIIPKGDGNLIELKDDEKYIIFDYTTVTGVVGANRNAMISALSAIFNSGDLAAIEDVELSVDELKATQTDGTQKTQVVNSAGVSSDSILRTFLMTVTRPANTTAYTAGDVIGDVSAALTKFTGVAKAAGYGVYVKAIRIQTTDTGLAGKTLKLHFYNDSVTAIADNDPFAIADANYSKRDGSTTVTFGTGNVAKVGMNNYVDLPLNPVATDVHCIVETTEGFTPSANSTVIYVYIKCLLTA